ncbi:hypothetical protein [Plantactinospora sp. CA-290183]|uniref:hypothetical protein n=1 Tax=Plantactinospora sp. CA-290183 TaxID=3240006 RepID=UPI003D8BAFD0
MRLSAVTAGWDLGGLPYRILAADQGDWSEIPGVRLLGAVLGAALLIAALRAMFGGRR